MSTIARILFLSPAPGNSYQSSLVVQKYGLGRPHAVAACILPLHAGFCIWQPLFSAMAIPPLASDAYSRFFQPLTAG